MDHDTNLGVHINYLWNREFKSVILLKLDIPNMINYKHKSMLMLVNSLLSVWCLIFSKIKMRTEKHCIDNTSTMY